MEPSVYVQPPAYTQPVQPQPPVYTQPPVYVQPPIQPQPPAYTQPPVVVTPTPSETSTQGPYAPITVTVYPPVPPPHASFFPADVMPPFHNLEDLPPPPPVSGVRLIPATNILPNKTYKLQVGSYKVARNAVDTYVKLRAAGLTPEYERNGEFFRVVLKGVLGSEVQAVADKLGMTGFQEAVIREE